MTRDWVHMGDRSQVHARRLDYSAASPTSGKGDVILGVKTKVGGLSTRGLAFLRLQSEVHGAFYAASVNKEAQVIAPAVQAPPAGEPSKVSWNVSFTAATTANAVTVKGATRALPPGRYGAVQVQSKGILKLAAGAYYFDSFKFGWRQGRRCSPTRRAAPSSSTCCAGFAHNGVSLHGRRPSHGRRAARRCFSSDTLNDQDRARRDGRRAQRAAQASS